MQGYGIQNNSTACGQLGAYQRAEVPPASNDTVGAMIERLTVSVNCVVSAGERLANVLDPVIRQEAQRDTSGVSPGNGFKAKYPSEIGVQCDRLDFLASAIHALIDRLAV